MSTQRAKDTNTRIASFGSAKKIEMVGVERSEARTSYLFMADTGRRMFLWRVAFDVSGKISEMNLEEEE